MTAFAKSAAPVMPATVDGFVRAALEKAGLTPAAAADTAAALVLADSMGVHTHGTKLLAGYLKKLLGGGYRAAGMPRIVREGPAWGVLDGDSALGQVGCSFATRLAIAKARTTGVAYVGLVNTGHIGAAGGYAVQAAREGMLCIVVGNDVPSVAAPGSRKAVLGSNPLAWAAPVPDGDPIFLDIATAAVAGGKVYAALQRGETIPDSWLIGPDGLPTSDGSLYPQQAALAPMAGHKGYGIGLLVEFLSGVLPGGTSTWQIGSWMFDPAAKPSLHNAGFVAIDVAAVAEPATYRAAVERLTAEIHAAETAVGVERVLLPGEREWRQVREAETAGIRLPADVRAKLDEAAALVGIPPLG